MSTKEFAEKLGVPSSTVRYWLRKGKIKDAVHIQDERFNHWDIPESALKEFSVMRPKRGRPKGAKNKAKPA